MNDEEDGWVTVLNDGVTHDLIGAVERHSLNNDGSCPCRPVACLGHDMTVFGWLHIPDPPEDDSLYV